MNINLVKYYTNKMLIMDTYSALKAEILSDRATRSQLKSAIKSFEEMDSIDALKDAELLFRLLKLRIEK